MNVRINEFLELTPFERSDKSNLLLYMNDPELYANTARVPWPYTEADADNWLEFTAKELRERGFPVNWALRSSEHGLIGGIGCFLLTGDHGHRDEIGYWIAQPFRGAGIMTGVVKRYCEYLFETRPELVRIEARVYPHNPASVRLLEKLGFEREGYARKMVFKNGEFLDNILMVLFR